MKVRISAAVGFAAFVSVGHAYADQHTIEFTGVVDSVGINLSSAVDVGDDVYGCFTYETNATDQNPSDDRGEYLDSLSGFYIEIGSAVAVNSDAGKVRIWNNVEGVYDAFGAIVTALEQPPVPPPEITLNGRTLKHYQFLLADGPGSATNLDSDNIPTGDMLVAAFTNGNGNSDINYMRFSKEEGDGFNDNDITWAIGSFATTDLSCDVVNPPVTPTEAIVGVMDDIDLLGLGAGTEKSLLAKLNVALKLLNDQNADNDVVAINSLNAFIRAVNAQSGKKISSSDAQSLVSSAEAIIAAIAGI